jgi:putative transposase
MKRIERIRLYPTSRQAMALRFMLDVTCQLYNAALQERRDAYRLRGISIGMKAQYAELTGLRGVDALDSRLSAVYRECEDAVLRRLDLAFAAFFRRCKRGEAPGFPRFKPAARWHQLTFPHGDRALKFDAEQQRVTVPGLGRVKLRKGRAVPAFGRAWLVERTGRWYCCFECEVAPVQGPVDLRQVVGVDRGVAVLAALDDGTRIGNAAVSEKRKAATARLQRDLTAASEYIGSGRGRRCVNRRDPKRVAAVKRLARAREREANVRRDHEHKVARQIVDGASVVALEALNLRGMTRSAKGTVTEPGRNVAAKAGLNRVMLDAGFGLLEQMISSKAERAGKLVVRVDARYSSQTCSRCDHVNSKNRRGRRFCCLRCGHRAHADVEAAREIRRRAELRPMSELTPAEDAGRDARCAA